jgi:hypothetical protein
MKHLANKYIRDLRTSADDRILYSLAKIPSANIQINPDYIKDSARTAQ